MTEVRRDDGMLSVSIVTHAPDLMQLSRTVATLGAAAGIAREQGYCDRVRLTLVDNGPTDRWQRPLREMLDREWLAKDHGPGLIVSPGRNLGFGAGHNLALFGTKTRYHLVLNPDVEMADDALSKAIQFMEEDTEVGFLTPFAVDDARQRQYLCKRYPTVLDLLLRGFVPAPVCHLFRGRLARYEMQDVTRDATVKGLTIASGCFMFLRRSVLDDVGGFSPRFFLYFEDFDLSLRLAQRSRIAYVPSVRIVHHGGRAARKGGRHIWLFGRSAVAFCHLHGWKWV